LVIVEASYVDPVARFSKPAGDLDDRFISGLNGLAQEIHKEGPKPRSSFTTREGWPKRGQPSPPVAPSPLPGREARSRGNYPGRNRQITARFADAACRAKAAGF